MLPSCFICLKKCTFTSFPFGVHLFCASRILDQLQNFDEVFSENVVLYLLTYLSQNILVLIKQTNFALAREAVPLWDMD